MSDSSPTHGRKRGGEDISNEDLPSRNYSTHPITSPDGIDGKSMKKKKRQRIGRRTGVQATLPSKPQRDHLAERLSEVKRSELSSVPGKAAAAIASDDDDDDDGGFAIIAPVSPVPAIVIQHDDDEEDSGGADESKEEIKYSAAQLGDGEPSWMQGGPDSRSAHELARFSRDAASEDALDQRILDHIGDSVRAGGGDGIGSIPSVEDDDDINYIPYPLPGLEPDDCVGLTREHLEREDKANKEGDFCAMCYVKQDSNRGATRVAGEAHSRVARLQRFIESNRPGTGLSQLCRMIQVQYEADLRYTIHPVSEQKYWSLRRIRVHLTNHDCSPQAIIWNRLRESILVGDQLVGNVMVKNRLTGATRVDTRTSRELREQNKETIRIAKELEAVTTRGRGAGVSGTSGLAVR